MTPHTSSYPDNRFYVYILLRETGVPFYVGKGTNRRWLDHEKDAKYRDTYKDRIVRKMVADGHKIIRGKYAENLTEIEAFSMEIALIKAIGRYPNGPLANATDGGEGNFNPPLEVRAKISAANKGNRYAVGHKSTPKQLEALAKGRIKERYTEQSSNKIAEKLRGRKLSEEHKSNISAGNKGKTISEEQKRKIGIAHRRENMSEESLRNIREKNLGQKRSLESREKMRLSRIKFLEEENKNPKAVEARRISASKAGFERWRIKRLNQQQERL